MLPTVAIVLVAGEEKIENEARPLSESVHASVIANGEVDAVAVRVGTFGVGVVTDVVAVYAL